jgi:stage II sporulation protein D
MPDDNLTYTQAAFLLRLIDPELDIPFGPSVYAVPYAVWIELYIEALKNISNGDLEGFFGIERVTLIPLRSVDNGVFTDNGPFDSAGIDMVPYLDTEITALVKEGEILAVLTVECTQPLVRGAYIRSSDGERISIYIGGAERTYPYLNLHRSDLSAGRICDIRVSQGTAVEVRVLGETVAGTVNRITAEYTELRDKALLPNSPYIRVYDVSGRDVVYSELGNIITGSNVNTFIVENGFVRAVIINQQATVHNIRVLLSTTNFRGHRHESVTVQSDSPFTVWAGGAPYIYRPGLEFTVAPGVNMHLFSDLHPRIYIISNVQGAKFEVLNIQRHGGKSPAYRGLLEISLEPDGSFLIVNEVSLEEYLYAVISNENIDLFGFEAVKVQAVIARSYAYNQFYANRFSGFGAHVDDSVFSQVYNNFPECNISMDAVYHTRGLMLSHGGNVISGSFFSTSAGVTANSGEVWADINTKNFPGTTLPHLQSTRFYTGANYGNLRVESNASAFLRDWNVQGYDSAFPWFRWNVEMTAAQISRSINASIGMMYYADPSLIQTLQPDGDFRSRPVNTIGELLDLIVISRGEGGNIMTVMLTGSEATVLVHTEQYIRMLLAPSCGFGGEVLINRHIGAPVPNLPIMPSAFFVFDKYYSSGQLSSVIFHGGGYGHGAGMSLSGARGMSMAGYNFNQILRRYFRDAVIVRKW